MTKMKKKFGKNVGWILDDEATLKAISKKEALESLMRMRKAIKKVDKRRK